MQIKDLITSRVCGNTVFENSWIWYCDECRQHGTAVSSKEADFMAQAHFDYFSYTTLNEDEAPEFDTPEYEDWAENNILDFANATEEQRFEQTFDNAGCVIYIIDEGNNITYNFGDDYEDKTPNNVTDIQKMIDLQKQLGLE